MSVDLARKKDVFEILQQFGRGGIEPLKELFWSRLNYDRVNEPISRKGWTDEQRAALAEDPMLWASGGQSDAFHVIYGRLASGELRRTPQRPVIERLLMEHPYALFVFSNDAQIHWHLVNVKYDDKVEKRRLFRRIALGPFERLRTAAERVSMFDLEAISPEGRAGILPATNRGQDARAPLSPLAIQQAHDEAFDVEKVQKEFFRTLQAIYEESLVPDIQAKLKDETKAREAGLIVLNRLIFLYFIQKKGWLRQGRSEKEEARGAEYLFRAYKEHRGKAGAKTYYTEFLCPLFQALATPKSDRNVIKDYDRFAGIPFLNGGLFEPDVLATRDADLHVTNATFARLFDDLLERYNFTVTEDTPLDVEVAVDPEMLGKIFEELVTGRHESGAYYTPRPVVSFMCKEALKGYLVGQAFQPAFAFSQAGKPAPRFQAALLEPTERFIENHDASGLTQPEAILDKLRDVKVCDPACGSGAYLVGMLQELMALRHALFAAHQVDAHTDYQRKLDIIQNNLYGVDIDPIAVNIARLRLWLTLCVEYEGERGHPAPGKEWKGERGHPARDEWRAGRPPSPGEASFDPPPLPNLDFKIELGDSVTGPPPRNVQTDTLTFHLIEEFEEIKSRYSRENIYGHKAALRKRIEELRKEIGAILHPGEKAAGFDWSVEIAEVMAAREQPGFDIVIANPPYVRQELIRPLKPRLKELFPEVYTGTADLFTFFFARAMELLRPRGLLVFICSSTWTKTAAAEKLRVWLRERSTVHRFLDFGDLPVFESVTTYPAIVIAEKRKPSEDHAVRSHQVKAILTSELEEELHAPGILVPQRDLEDSGWRFEDRRIARLRQKIKSVGKTVGDYCDGKCYRGITTGLNEAFVIDGRTRDALVAADPKSAGILKPFLEGKDLKPWRAQWRGLWLIFTRRGIKIEDYTAIHDWLKAFRKRLEPRPRDWEEKNPGRQWPGRKPGLYKWYEIQDSIDYHAEFDKPKILSTKVSYRPGFSWDDSGFYTSNTAYFLPRAGSLRFLVGFLNSSVFQFYARSAFVQKQNAFYEIQPEPLLLFPVPQVTKANAKTLDGLVQALSSEDCSNRLALEAELNDRVAALYSLTPEERKIIAGLGVVGGDAGSETSEETET